MSILVQGIPNENSYRSKLISELLNRQKKNAAYSLRSFARDLKISPATLSQTLNAKRNLSKLNLLKVADRLAFSPTETQTALLEISNSHPENRDLQFNTLSDDTFKMMSDWYYFAILSLAKAGRAKSDSAWLSERFGITPLQAKDAVERLERLGLVEILNGKIKCDGMPLKTTSDVPSAAARSLQHDHLRLADLSLERDSLMLRDMTSMTFVADLKCLPRAKEMIKSFRRKLSTFLEGDGTGSEVYVFALQLFPVSKKEEL